MTESDRQRIFGTTRPQANGHDKPLISLVVLTYNQAAYAVDALNGALAQTYEPLEIIISDDCSTDETFSHLKKAAISYSGKHRLILRQNNKNKGILGHLLEVASAAKGEILVVAAGDDTSMVDRVKTVQQAFQRRPKLGALCSAFEVISANSTHLASRTPSPQIPMEKALTNTGIQKHIYGATSAYRTKLLREFPAPSSVVHVEDFVLSVGLQVRGFEIGLLPQPLVKVRDHVESVWGHSQKNCADSNDFMQLERHEMRKAKLKLAALKYIKENEGFFRQRSLQNSVHLDWKKLRRQLDYYDYKSRWNQLSIRESARFIYVNAKMGSIAYAVSRVLGEHAFSTSRRLKNAIARQSPNCSKTF